MQQEKKEQLISTYRTQYQTTDVDLQIWQELSQEFLHNPNYKLLAPLMEGLKFDTTARKAVVGVHHQFHLGQLEHPKMRDGLKRDIGFVMGVQLEKLEFVVLQ